jgi:hypothetical protein
LISNCTISNNKGDGLSLCYGEISNCIISGNTKSGLAGCRGGPIRNCVITGNAGGGVAGCKSVDSCTITGNTGDRGGGLTSCDFIRNCIIVGNYASYGGGIFCGEDPCLTSTIVNCTIGNNRASDEGGGIYCIGSDAVVTNSILWANKAKWGRDNEIALIENSICIIGQYCSYVPSTATISYSDIKGGPEEVFIDVNCTLTWGEGNIDADPCFANLYCADYHLKSQAGRWDPNNQSWVQDNVTSLCIDTGDPMSPIGLEPFPNGGIINMGAYGGTAEASKSYFGKPPCETIVAGDINGDCIVNLKDFALMAFHWLEEN